MCEICRHIPCYTRCPNYTPQKAQHYCSSCDEGIYEGEEYIEKDDEYRHYECFSDIEDVLKWLGYEVKTM